LFKRSEAGVVREPSDPMPRPIRPAKPMKKAKAARPSMKQPSVAQKRGASRCVLAAISQRDAPGRGALIEKRWPTPRGSRQKAVETALKRQGSFSHGIKIEADGGAKRVTPTTVASLLSPAKRLRKTGSVDADLLSPQSPYASFAVPSAAEVTKLHAVLARNFGERRPGKREKRDILDTVVGTILSQNTTNTNSHRAFEQLVAKFPTWDAVRTAKPSAVESAIRCAGLAPKKTPWIQHILKTVHRERGKTSMEYLRKESKEQVHLELERFTGVGKKTSAIINLFDVGHPDMAVDTHVFRYACQLGWVPTEEQRKAHNSNKSNGKLWPVVTRDTVYAHLDCRVPDQLKYSMHLILTDTVGGLPVVCGSKNELSFDGRTVKVDGSSLKVLIGQL